MDLRKKLFSIVGALALTMSMTAGIASAQDVVTTSDGLGITFVVACGAANSGAGTSTATIGSSDAASDSISFETFDAAASEDGIVTTAPGAFRVNVSLFCPSVDWSVTASVNDFGTQDDIPLTFPGTHFQLLGTGAWTTDGTTPAVNVAEPAAAVAFSGEAAPYTSTALAQATGTTTDSSMYMDFTGQLVDLDGTIENGDYSATVTVTFNASGTP